MECVISPTSEFLLLVVLKAVNLCPEVFQLTVLLDLAFPPRSWIWRLGRPLFLQSLVLRKSTSRIAGFACLTPLSRGQCSQAGISELMGKGGARWGLLRAGWVIVPFPAPAISLTPPTPPQNGIQTFVGLAARHSDEGHCRPMWSCCLPYSGLASLSTSSGTHVVLPQSPPLCSPTSQEWPSHPFTPATSCWQSAPWSCQEELRHGVAL